MRNATTVVPRNMIGRVVSTPMKVLGVSVTHTGILAGCCPQHGPTVIAASREKGQVVRESLLEFSGGADVEDEGFPSALPPQEVVRRACQHVGTPYDLLSFNCEHLVRLAHGLPVHSPQVAGAMLTVMGLGGIIAAINKQ